MSKTPILTAAVVAFALLLLSSCSTRLSDYENQGEALDLKTYFDGPVVAWGMLQDYNEKVTRRFCVEMVGTWKQQDGTDVGVLDEMFYFDDGEVSQRVWTLTRQRGTAYVGSASDVVGEASGESKGFAFQWQYTLEVTVDGSTYEFQLDDWIYQMDEYRLFNRTDMNKFGMTLATITIFFDKEQPLRNCKSFQTK